MNPNAEQYIREASQISYLRRWHADDMDAFGRQPQTAEYRRWLAGQNLALRLRATTLRLDSLALRGAATALIPCSLDRRNAK